jgi:L,D-transpeptidase ErfK/SrfK
MNNKIGLVLSGLFLLTANHAYASVYQLPPSSESLIGQIQQVTVGSNDSAVNIAKKYDLGYNALECANPQLDMAKPFPYGATVELPTEHLLPNRPRKGIVVNLPEMRMYYYPEGSNQVITYPIGIGKIGQTIPITETMVTKKTENPVWIPTQNIREFNLKQGIILPQVMPAGPDNPLGHYAIYMTVPTYLMHSTIYPESIGNRASFGCLRTVKKGIPVAIINTPTKVGWQNDHLYMETTRILEEHGDNYDVTIPGMVHLVSDMSKDEPVLIDWQAIAFMASVRDGVPHEIGVKIKS